MLQVNFIKTNRETVLSGLAKKHFSETSLVDQIISNDDERKKLQFELDELQSSINAISKEIGQFISSGKKQEAEEEKQELEKEQRRECEK